MLGRAVVPWYNSYYSNRNITYDASNKLLEHSFFEDAELLKFSTSVNGGRAFYNTRDQNIPFLGCGQEATLDREGYGTNGKEDEQEDFKRAATGTLKKKKLSGPAVDKKYFTKE